MYVLSPLNESMKINFKEDDEIHIIHPIHDGGEKKYQTHDGMIYDNLN